MDWEDRLEAWVGESDTKICRALLIAWAIAVVVTLGIGLSKAPSPDWLWIVASLVTAALGLSLLLVASMRRRLRVQALLMSGAHDGAFDWDPVSKRLRVGKRLLAILGYSDNFLRDTHGWLEIVHPDDRGRYNQAVAAHLKGLTGHFYCEYRVRANTGEYRWLAARGVALRNGKGIATQMAGSVSDITDRIEREQQIRNLAMNDQLTALPNRPSLIERLPQAIAEAERNAQEMAVLFIDLDRFKNVNDTSGHLFGDALLVALSRRLSVAMRSRDLLLRQGGDELVAVLLETGREEATEVARRLLELIAEPVRVGGSEIRITASIGVAMYPADGRDADALLRSADIAMYAAKADGGNEIRFFEHAMHERVNARATMENRLRGAIEHGELMLHFQPQFRLSDNVLVGAEALVRWRDGASLVSPEVFIPIAEETGLIIPLGRWVINAAVAQFAEWLTMPGAPQRLSINLSPRQFQRHAVERDVLEALARHGVRAELIELEVTESVFLGPADEALRALHALREAGCRIALDDFGTGYSSLSYLQLLELDSLKIDKSFIANLSHGGANENRSGTAIVAAIIALGHRLGYEVIAEGVESQPQLDWLCSVGCESAQGYYFSRPLEAGAFAQRFMKDLAKVA